MFEPEQIGGIGWLLPAALVFAVALLVWRGRAARRDLRRAAIGVLVLWLLVTTWVFSYMAGIFHPYYTVALAPPIAALTGIGIAVSWQERQRLWVRVALAVAVVLTAATAVIVLRHVPGFYPWLRWAVPLAAVLVLAGLIVTAIPMPVIIAAGVLVAFGGPVAYSVTTVERGNSGALPITGPVPRVVTAMTKGVAPAQRAEITSVSGPGFLLPRDRPPPDRIWSAAACWTPACPTGSWSACSTPMRSDTPGWPRPSDRCARPGINWPAVTR